ncbi:hypothetical protein JK636_03320 [Clostridium sp. YIM B02515]|uniref:Uncharacterized protein n=1 Tax=Clostridium rhizosphaerae TaxID=2803861 RepID=A0ABS1T606_9CLOT|nr:hypothetical protein [Clostridium rhizosphaerae]MBL4934786.1 hypothetical protein [Clostridium rhizosphaerae]
MPDGFGIVNDLARHIGQTVTIFTTSGGESGRGFTGILASVNNRFVRLIVQIGSAPGCALGSCCDDRHDHCDCDRNSGREMGIEFEMDRDRNRNRDRDRFDCNGRTLGAIVDIPVDRIAAFVHNAVGSGW